jgi:cytochrome bd-type quinol oxidase subunit 2
MSLTAQRRGNREYEWTSDGPDAYKLSATDMETVIRLLIIGVLVAIVASLGSALFQLSRKAGDSRKLARDLTIRIGLSVALFILLMLAWRLGLIRPHGLGAAGASSPQ